MASKSLTEFRFSPLPSGWPRKVTASRRGTTYFRGGYGDTLTKLRYEIGKLDPRGPVIIQADFREREIRQDGLPRGDARQPEFPGVIVNLTSNHQGQLRFLCDDCQRWWHNLHAIALTLERLRLCDLYGVTKDGEQYKGWKSLPAPEHVAIRTVDDAARFLVTNAARPANAARVLVDGQYARDLYHEAARRLHPDAGGAADVWQVLQAAWGLIKPLHARAAGQEADDGK